MKTAAPIALVFCLLLCPALAPADYITDKLYVGLYNNPENPAKPDKILTSGTSLKILERKGTYIRVELEDGVQGWVERRYIVGQEPAVLSLIGARKEAERLRVELDQTRNELASVQKELSSKQPDAADQQLKEQLDAANQKVTALEAQLKQSTETQAGQPAAPQPGQQATPQPVQQAAPQPGEQAADSITCEQQLDDMEAKQLQCQVRLAKYTKDDQGSVISENEKLRERMQQAANVLGLPANGEVPALVPLSEMTALAAKAASQAVPAPPVQPEPKVAAREAGTSLPVWVYLLMVLTMITGIIAGFALFDYRSRYRYSIRL